MNLYKLRFTRLFRALLRLNAGRLEKLAVQHCLKLRDLYNFDESEAERVVSIVSQFKHTKGKWKGTRFNLLPHQAFYLAYLFGLKRDNGTRLIRETMLNMAKKGGKSEFDGAITVLTGTSRHRSTRA